MQPDVTTEAIERALSLDILRGRYAPGSRLPTVRELAATHAVNPATIQRVVARLETRGLVVARQGSGLRVEDPRLVGDVGLLPLWLVALGDRPAEAARVLDEFLELRRALAARLLVRHRDALLARAAELAEAASGLLGASDGGPRALAAADLAFTRGLLELTDSTVARAVFNTLARVLDESPTLAAAMYARPADNAHATREVLEALRRGGKGLAAAVERALHALDARTVTRFERALEKAGRA